MYAGILKNVRRWKVIFKLRRLPTKPRNGDTARKACCQVNFQHVYQIMNLDTLRNIAALIQNGGFFSSLGFCLENLIVHWRSSREPSTQVLELALHEAKCTNCQFHLVVARVKWCLILEKVKRSFIRAVISFSNASVKICGYTAHYNGHNTENVATQLTAIICK